MSQLSLCILALSLNRYIHKFFLLQRKKIKFSNFGVLLICVCGMFWKKQIGVNIYFLKINLQMHTKNLALLKFPKHFSDIYGVFVCMLYQFLKSLSKVFFLRCIFVFSKFFFCKQLIIWFIFVEFYNFWFLRNPICYIETTEYHPVFKILCFCFLFCSNVVDKSAKKSWANLPALTTPLKTTSTHEVYLYFSNVLERYKMYGDDL